MPRLLSTLVVAIFTAGGASAEAQDGATLHPQRCQACHESGAVRAPTREVIALLAPDRIVQALESGVMREQGTTLSEPERRAVAAFLSRAAAPASTAPARSVACAATAAALTPAAAGDWNGWDSATAQPFDTVNGVKASGGSIDIGGAAVSQGMVLTTSGYGQWGGKPGNVLLAFGVD